MASNQMRILIIYFSGSLFIWAVFNLLDWGVEIISDGRVALEPLIYISVALINVYILVRYGVFLKMFQK